MTTRHLQTVNPPQLILHFWLQTISPSNQVVRRLFLFDPPYQNIMNDAAWDQETQQMLSQVAADHVNTTDLALLVLAFRRYTRIVLSRFPIMELFIMRFISVIEIPPVAPSLSTSHLHYFVPPETQQYFLEVDDDDEPIRGPTSAPVSVVERLQMKIAESPDLCSICLDEFDIRIHVLEMPCRHIFHNECLREWLTRSNTCPLCRFRLSNAE